MTSPRVDSDTAGPTSAKDHEDATANQGQDEKDREEDNDRKDATSEAVLLLRRVRTRGGALLKEARKVEGGARGGQTARKRRPSDQGVTIPVGRGQRKGLSDVGRREEKRKDKNEHASKHRHDVDVGTHLIATLVRSRSMSQRLTSHPRPTDLDLNRVEVSTCEGKEDGFSSWVDGSVAVMMMTVDERAMTSEG